MSSNSNARALRAVAIVALTALAAACASAPPSALQTREPVIQSEQFTAAATTYPDQILLAPHAEGVSSAQIAALTALVDRWHDSGGGPIVIQAPGRGGGSVYSATTSVVAELEALGVGESNVEVIGYEGDSRPRTPIVVGFDHYVAVVPKCGRNMSSFNTTVYNTPQSNFGCATTANLAALVANPADLEHPQAMAPSDAARREVVIGKYRAGTIMSSAKDDQADTQISDAVQ